MGTISVSLPLDGTTADVGDYNTPITTIVNTINGGIDNSNLATGAAIDGGKLGVASVTPTQLSAIDWFKSVPSDCFSTTIAGTWINVAANTATGISGWDAVESAGAQNEEIQYKIVLGAGTYKVNLHHDKDVNRGIYTVSVNGSSIGTADAYNTSAVRNFITVVSTTLVISTGALCTLNIKMATKNASSSAYYGHYFGINFVRTA